MPAEILIKESANGGCDVLVKHAVQGLAEGECTLADGIFLTLRDLLIDLERDQTCIPKKLRIIKVTP